MKMDLYKREMDSGELSAPGADGAYLAAPAGEPLPPEIIQAGWAPEEPSVEIGAAEALELFDISEDSLIEQIEGRGYALSSNAGQVRAASALAQSGSESL